MSLFKSETYSTSQKNSTTTTPANHQSWKQITGARQMFPTNTNVFHPVSRAFSTQYWEKRDGQLIPIQWSFSQDDMITVEKVKYGDGIDDGTGNTLWELECSTPPENKKRNHTEYPRVMKTSTNTGPCIFHETFLDKWFEDGNNNCPNCKHVYFR